ncbi:MAG: hypothetical protein RIQ96_2182, partial [Pseudomonadota bacterium]
MKHLMLSAVATAAILSTLPAHAASHAAAPVDPTTMVNQFEATGGKFEGYRRSGAKGICATGEFVGSA